MANENRMAVARGARWNKAAAGWLAGGKGRTALLRPAVELLLDLAQPLGHVHHLVRVEVAARAGTRRFWRSSALRAHTKAPYITDLLWKTLRALKRPGRPGHVPEADLGRVLGLRLTPQRRHVLRLRLRLWLWRHRLQLVRLLLRVVSLGPEGALVVGGLGRPPHEPARAARAVII